MLRFGLKKLEAFSSFAELNLIVIVTLLSKRQVFHFTLRQW